jgi:2-dehydro-3-deoxyphosphogluconate aldolase/(4S)-4-hydroxy-2-oxoglutarate aldolase
MKVLDAIKEYKVVCIIRKVRTEQILQATEIMLQEGIRLFEVTLDQSSEEGIKESLRQIGLLKKTFEDRIYLGAGTVMTEEQVNRAKGAGAAYIISPNTDEAVIRQTVKQGLVSIPGAMTPTEIAFAYRCGAHMVKLFPAGTLGPRYIKDLQGPLGYIPLIAVGGVDVKNMKDFLDAGVQGVGIGSSLTGSSVINDGKWDVLRERAKAYVEIVNQYRGL